MITILAIVMLSSMASLVCASDPFAPEMVLRVGDSEIVECEDATRAAIGDPVVADVVALSTSDILVNAKNPGTTVLYIWDKNGRRLFRVKVVPGEVDMEALCARITSEIGDPRITARGVGNTVILEGTVNREAESSKAEAIAQAVVETVVFQGTTAGSTSQETKSVGRPEGDSFVLEKVVSAKEVSTSAETGLRVPKVVNLINVEKAIDEVTIFTLEIAAAFRQALNEPALTVRALPGSVVLIEGNVGTAAEMERINLLIKGYSKENESDKVPGGTKEVVTMINMVKLDSSRARQIMVRAQVVDINKEALKEFGVNWGRIMGGNLDDNNWLIGQSGTGPFDLFGGGAIDRLDPIGARIRALEQQDKAKILSQPNLLVLDGREGSILVGGEIPIPVPQTSSTGGGTTITIEYKEYGVRLKVVPEVTGEGTLQLQVMPEVSTLSEAGSITINGFDVPALRTRRAETTVSVRDGQSLIIGGLIHNEDSKLVNKIPILGDIPIIGELFKSRRFQNNESELVIIITPQIMQPTAMAQG